MLAHRRSRLGAVRNPGVLVVTSAATCCALVSDSPTGSTTGSAPSIQRLIRHDHDFHDKRATTAPRQAAHRAGRPSR